MKILIIGCGTAFSKKLFNQSFLLTESDNKGTRRMIIDFGAKIPMALNQLNIPMFDIDDVYISHAHSDHIGGLEEFAFTRYNWNDKPRKWDDYLHPERDYLDPNIKYNRYAPRLICNENLMYELWNYSFRGGLESMEGFDAHLDTFFEPVPVKPNVNFIWQGWDCKLIQQIHIMTGSVIKHTWGLFMKKTGHRTVYFTMDSQHCSPRQMEVFYKNADIIFQDCECSGVDTKKRLFMFSSGVHANYAQLAGYPSANSIVLPDVIKAKMILSHYQDFVPENKDSYGNPCEWDKLAQDDGFKEFTKVGKIYEV